MSKKNQQNQESKKSVEVGFPLISAENLEINTASAPSEMTFEEMQKAVAEFKKLQKIIKALPKEDRAKLLPPVRAREIPEGLLVLADYIKKGLVSHYDNINPEFAKTVTTDKPNGNKSISLSWEDCDFSVAIIRKAKKEKSE